MHPRYESSNFKSDLIAGATVGVMVIPQSMAYALIAGLPTVYGLYSAFIPLFAYSVFGSSRHLAVGPVAIVSLLVESGISPLIDQSLDEAAQVAQYVHYALLTAFVSGLCMVCMGLLRLGFLVNFLSHSVISGFTTGAAVVIGVTQVKHLVRARHERRHRCRRRHHDPARAHRRPGAPRGAGGAGGRGRWGMTCPRGTGCTTRCMCSSATLASCTGPRL